MSDTTEHKKSIGGFSLRVVIIGLVLTNALAVALITVSIGVTTNSRSIAVSADKATQDVLALAVARQDDASRYISDRMTSYFDKMYSAASSVASAFERGVISLADVDTAVPFLGTVMRNLGIADTIAISLVSHEPRNVVTLSPTEGTAISGSYKLVYTMWTTGLTCQRFCPVSPSTNGSIFAFGLDPATFSILGSTVNFPFDFSASSPGSFVKMPKGQAMLDTPEVVGPIIIQKLHVPLYNANGSNVGTTDVTITIEYLSDYLNVVKRSTSANSLFYILSTKAQVLAMSGFANQTEAAKTLKKTADPTRGIFSLKTIFEFDRTTYPLLNISSEAVNNLANGNLSNKIADTTWTVEGYVFRATSLTLYGNQYILVSGAPLADYVGDILQLRSSLEADGARTTLIVVFSALAIVVVLAALSLLFSWYFITKPLGEILMMMKQATKFDFSYIREGSATSRRSIVQEIHATQDNFMAMIKVFADALKQNKALLQRKTTSNTSGNDALSASKSGTAFASVGPRSPAKETWR